MLTKKEWDVLQEFAYILSVSFSTYTHTETHRVLVPPQRPASDVRGSNSLAGWGYPRLRNFHQRMGKIDEETTTSRPFYPTRSRRSM